MRNAEKVGLTTTKHETTCQEMLNAISDGLSDLASSDDREHGEDEDDDKEQHLQLGKLSEDDKPSWVMGTISKPVQHRMDHFRPKQTKLNGMTQPGWGEAANNFHERDKKYGMTKLKVPTVVQQQTADDAASTGPTTVGEPMETLDTIPRKSQMPQLTTPPGSSQMRLDSGQPQTRKHILSIPPNIAADSLPTRKSMLVELVSSYGCK